MSERVHLQSKSGFRKRENYRSKVLGGILIREENNKDCPEIKPCTGTGEACLLKVRVREATAAEAT